jgi:hypothetical protein
VALDGSSESIVGCSVITTIAKPLRLVSSELVAMTESVFGVGALVGAV